MPRYGTRSNEMEWHRWQRSVDSVFWDTTKCESRHRHHCHSISMPNVYAPFKSISNRTIFLCFKYMMKIAPNVNGVHEIWVQGMNSSIKHEYWCPIDEWWNRLHLFKFGAFLIERHRYIKQNIKEHCHRHEHCIHIQIGFADFRLISEWEENYTSVKLKWNCYVGTRMTPNIPMHWSIRSFNAIIPVGQQLQFKIADQINSGGQTVQRIPRK